MEFSLDDLMLAVKGVSQESLSNHKKAFSFIQEYFEGKTEDFRNKFSDAEVEVFEACVREFGDEVITSYIIGKLLGH